MKSKDVRKALIRYSWKNASTQTIFSKHVPAAYKILDPQNTFSETECEKIERHILLFFKPFCVTSKRITLNDLIERYKEFKNPGKKASEQVSAFFLRDAKIREDNMIQDIGGQEFWEKLFD